MTAVAKADVTVVILAGGMGRRMGGQDKGLVPFQGKPLINHVVDAMRRQSECLVINANRNLDQYRSLGYPVVADDLDGYQGPLAGFLAAMEVVDSDFILTLPCDGPFIRPDYVERMLQRLNDTAADIVVAADEQRMQPVYALIPVALRQDLQEFLDTGQRKIDAWYARHDTQSQVFESASGFFTNINTPQELQVSQ